VRRWSSSVPRRTLAPHEAFRPVRCVTAVTSGLSHQCVASRVDPAPQSGRPASLTALRLPTWSREGRWLLPSDGNNTCASRAAFTPPWENTTPCALRGGTGLSVRWPLLSSLCASDGSRTSRCAHRDHQLSGEHFHMLGNKAQRELCHDLM